MPSLLLTHPAGNQNVRAVLAATEGAGQLARFATTVAAFEGDAPSRLLPGALRREWLRRRFDIAPAKVLTHPARELARMVAAKAGWQGAVRHEAGFASPDAVFQDFDRFVAARLPGLARTHGLTAVYAYEDSALHTFRAARALGLRCIYDLPIAYWETGRRLMQEEAERLPEWAATLGGGVTDSAPKLERKTEELALADMVVAPSGFVLDSLPASATRQKRVLTPFGSPPSSVDERSSEVPDPGRPLRVLFVGSMGQRKGLADLFAAMRLLEGRNIELVVLGSLQESPEFYRRQCEGMRHEKGRPHAQVLELMRSCDLFCLPSIVEGRALVTQEAMSQGLPIVITANTGGADLVIEGRTGFLVPIRAPEKIAETIAWFDDNRRELPAMKAAAMRHAAGYTWQHYGELVVDAIRELD
ncbi:glycosyltransferase family 4 protein [Variovorax sp. OV329]|uniref:glycosyltransferase family 4 protein n=1 Tax=Variovorax sp. OV329 TaxID=1882825 RepID=UPI0008F069BF|nr:glycosyltransferase [Variovorax sp. OV329]SFM10153.1 Glycosyl transferases group 1 [Variovorax sp. OV329]